MNAYYDAFDNYCQIEVEEDEDGGWVRYTDHKKIVDELQAKLDKLNENKNDQ